MGRQVIYREVEYQEMGHPHCRVIGRLADDWDNPEEDLQYYRATEFSKKDFEKQPEHSSKLVSPKVSDRLDKDWELIGSPAGFSAA